MISHVLMISNDQNQVISLSHLQVQQLLHLATELTDWRKAAARRAPFSAMELRLEEAKAGSLTWFSRFKTIKGWMCLGGFHDKSR